MILEYYNLFFAVLLIMVIACLILTLNYYMVYQSNYLEKITAYECGFQPFEDSINSFDIRYYLVAILFLIFDLELMFLLPWIISLPLISLAGYFSMFFFIFLLILGFYYEWLKGGLEWD